jgi:hydroxymethylglutaryl-CoA lyase
MAEIHIVECAPSEGLNSGRGKIEPKEKARFINHLSETGIDKVEAVSFIHPRLIPQHGDAEEVMKLIKKKPGVTYLGIAPNEVACRRAILTDIDGITVLVAASETFNQVALGYSTRAILNKVLPSVVNVALSEGKSIRAYLVASFGCPYEGKVAVTKVEELVSRLDFMGVSEVSLSDTTGMANPAIVKELLSALFKMDLRAKIGVHFHDTRGLGISNALAAFEAGVRIFDTAVGGTSTIPFGVPELNVATWDVPTEDLVNSFESMGIETGINLDRLCECVAMAEKITERQLPGHILRAGPNHNKYPPPQKLRIGYT